MNIKNIILVLFLHVVFLQLNAQISFKDTLLNKADMSTNSDVYSFTYIYNLSNKLDTIVWARTVNTLGDPAWTSAVCDIIQCHGATVSNGEFELAPNDTNSTNGYLAFHFYPDGKRGNGQMVVQFYRKSTPNIKTEITTNVTIWGAVNIESRTYRTDYVYPNPAKNTFQLSQNISTISKIEIVNSLGQVVLTTTADANHSVDISNIETGVYQVRVYDGVSINHFKLLKD
ncbi:MAG: T9SS type A sorting domain-containing protein [Bacteroidota bacterium]|nr:T9SS type A sorting domain-containing protein [Bacteroidota bacterium]